MGYLGRLRNLPRSFHLPEVQKLLGQPLEHDFAPSYADILDACCVLQ